MPATPAQRNPYEVAICRHCLRNMASRRVTSCAANQTIRFPDGKVIQAAPHANTDRCGDCNVKRGGFHHPGCDRERCPRCGGQLISCGCLSQAATMPEVNAA